MSLNKRALGRTGLEVTELSLGGLFVSSLGGSFEESKNATVRALEYGINYIDTAPGYFNSEEVLGKILQGLDRNYILSTKLGGRPKPFLPQEKSCLIQSVEQSLEFLNTDYIDILMIHEPDRPGEYDWWSDSEETYGPVMELLEELKRDGVIGFIGLGGTTAYEIVHQINSGRFDVLITAFNYSLLWREAEIDILPAAKAQNMGIIIGSPLQQGGLARRYDEYVNDPSKSRWLSTPRREQYKALYAFLDEIDIPIAEAGMRFVLSNPDITCVLTGVRSEQELELNIAAAEKGPLPEEYLKEIDAIAAMVPFRPYEEPFNLPFTSPYKGPGTIS